MACNWEWDSGSGGMAEMQKWARCLDEVGVFGMGSNWEWDSGSGVMVRMRKWAWCLGEGGMRDGL
jgi:hypothetical protein